MIRTGILTISDKGYRKERIDKTGPAIKEALDKDIY
jgi:molybdopterin biosynthesis enzyme MoaB